MAIILTHLQPTSSYGAIEGALSDSLFVAHDGLQRKISPKSSPKVFQFSAKIFSKFSLKASEKARQFSAKNGNTIGSFGEGNPNETPSQSENCPGCFCTRTLIERLPKHSKKDAVRCGECGTFRSFIPKPDCKGKRSFGKGGR